MKISTVKIQGIGYLINQKDSVINPQSKEWAAVKEWESDGGVIEPEFTQSELDAQAAQAVIDEANAQEDAAVRADDALKQFMELGPDGVSGFLDTNIDDPATRGVLKKMFKVLWVLALGRF